MSRFILVVMLSVFAIASHADSSFSKRQQEEIGKIAKDYLVKNPKFLIEASKQLQEQQEEEQRKAIIGVILGKDKKGHEETVADLIRDPDTPYTGPKNAQVAVVEFFDYQCAYCNKVAPAVRKLATNNPNVKFIYKDYPIFGDQWPASNYAANVGLLAFKQGGSTLYNKYHDAIFESGKFEGDLTVAEINKIAKTLKVSIDKTHLKISNKKQVSLISSIKNNMKLGGKLHAMGTPFIVVMPINNPTKDKITVFTGYPGNPDKHGGATSALQKAIRKASA